MRSRLIFRVLVTLVVSGLLVGAGSPSPAVVSRLDTPLIHSQRQADRLLPDTAKTFRKAVATRGRANHIRAREVCGLVGGIGVDIYDSRGFALVNTSSCGGAREIWKRSTTVKAGREHVRWLVVTGGQDWWDCRKLLRRSVPRSVVKPNTCVPASGMQALPYRPRSNGSQYAKF